MLQISFTQALISNMPALFASTATLIGVMYTTHKLHQGQVKAAEKAIQTAIELKRTTTQKAEEVKESLIVESVRYNDKLDTIHHLVNSALGGSLRFAALMARRLAQITKNKSDIALAKEATRVSDEHDKHQIESDLADQEANRPEVPLPEDTTGDGMMKPPPKITAG